MRTRNRYLALLALDKTPEYEIEHILAGTFPICGFEYFRVLNDDDFASGGDPVKLGLVASLNRPGGNVTGVAFVIAELGAKQLGLLHELQPGAVRVGVLVDPNYAATLEHGILAR